MIDDLEFVSLLSPKPLSEFEAYEFHHYVTSMYRKYVARKAAPEKKPPAPYTAKRNIKGVLVIKVTRVPKWLTHEELDLISESCAIPLNELFLRLQKSGVRTVATEEIGKQLTQFVAELPW